MRLRWIWRASDAGNLEGYYSGDYANIITGFLLAFTLSLDDFIISYFTTGSGVTNLSITIYTMTRRGIKPEINAVSTVMFLSILILLLIINKRSEKNNKKLEE